MNTRNALLTIIAFVFSASFAYADTPTVSSFTISPSTIANAFDVTLTWTIDNGDAQEVYFSCPEGVTLKKNGTSFGCNSRLSASSNPSDSVGFSVINVSGSTKTVTVTVYPKSAGVTNEAGSMTRTFTVATAAQPITDLTASKTTVDSGSPVTFTWTGVYAPASNFQFDCVNGLTGYSGTSVSGTPLPCGGPAFSSDQPTSGSVTLTFVNAFTSQLGAIVHVMPAIRAGLYDATHNLTTSIAVNPPQFTSTQVVKNTSITSLTQSAYSVQSRTPFTISWTSKDASSTNVQYSCSDAITLFMGNGTTTLPCGMPSFSTLFADAGTTTLIAVSNSYLPQNLFLTVLPQDSTGIYQLGGSKMVTISVTYQSTPLTPAAASSTATSTTVTQASTTTIATGPKGLSHVPFFRMLSRGSKGPEVVALQLFLGLNAQIFPENSASGFFGPATQRAVQRFQEKYGIAKSGAIGYGSVGPKTRTKLNALTLP